MNLFYAMGSSSGLMTPMDPKQRALLSLEGLAIGDALGEMLCYRCEQAAEIVASDLLPAGPWFHTDDTEMAIAIVATLLKHEKIEQDDLAVQFAERFRVDPDRGYGSMTRRQLHGFLIGKSWRETSVAAFGGQGSMGNGGAMRVAPLGAYFASDLPRVIAEATASCLVTHAHPEAVSGTIAIAVAAALAFETRGGKTEEPSAFLQQVASHTPHGEVRQGITIASEIPQDEPVKDVAKQLGSGFLVTAQDTVPFSLWCAAHHLHDYPTAIITAIQGNGDCDTNAAIVGGIVALSAGLESIPAYWRTCRERLPFSV